MSNCGICSKEYTRRRPLQVVCSLDCALLASRAKRIAKLSKAQASKDRKRKLELKTITQLRAEAQKEVNSYTRLRDSHLPCVSCGQNPYIGQRHASHFRPRSTASQLAYNLHNINASCAQCNSSKSGNLGPYRIELVKRIGLDKVEALENNSELANYSREYLIRMKEVFRKRVKHLAKLRNLARVEPF
jgi:5-methylcytosine-specific restriction endonuclease McrA